MLRANFDAANRDLNRWPLLGWPPQFWWPSLLDRIDSARLFRRFGRFGQGVCTDQDRLRRENIAIQRQADRMRDLSCCLMFDSMIERDLGRAATRCQSNSDAFPEERRRLGWSSGQLMMGRTLLESDLHGTRLDVRSVV